METWRRCYQIERIFDQVTLSEMKPEHERFPACMHLYHLLNALLFSIGFRGRKSFDLRVLHQKFLHLMSFLSSFGPSISDPRSLL